MFDRRAARLFILAQWGHDPRVVMRSGPYRALFWAFADAKLMMDEEASDPKRNQRPGTTSEPKTRKGTVADVLRVKGRLRER